MPQAHFARALFLSAVRREHAKALQEVARGRRIAPRDAELLSMAALAEQQLGRWDQALAHFRQAQSLDPQSFGTRRRLARVLLWLRRYPEARAMADSALSLSGGSPDVLDAKVGTFLGEGDLAGARAALRDSPSQIDLTRRIAHAGAYFNIFWVLDDEQQQLLLRLRPGPFDNDRGMWGLALAQTHLLRGNAAAARAYADSALPSFERAVASNPGDGILRGSLALALAIAGRRAEAVREGELAVRLEPIATNGITGPIVQHYLVLAYLALGDRDAALDHLEPLLRVPYFHLSRVASDRSDAGRAPGQPPLREVGPGVTADAPGSRRRPFSTSLRVPVPGSSHATLRRVPPGREPDERARCRS